MSLSKFDYLNIILTILTFLPFYLKWAKKRKKKKVDAHIYGAFLLPPKLSAQTGEITQQVRFVITNEGDQSLMITHAQICNHEEVLKEVEIFERLDKGDPAYKGETILNMLPAQGYEKVIIKLYLHGGKKPICREIIQTKTSDA